MKGVEQRYGEIAPALVTRRRGGYCFELNGLFAWLLKELGYNVREYFGRWLFSFDTTPQLPVDFAYAHYWCETHPSSSFRQRHWVYLPQADGSVRTLSPETDPETGEPAPVLAHIAPSRKTERTWLHGDAVFAAALREHFGIVEG